MSSLIYAIGDTHGAYDLLSKALEEIKEDGRQSAPGDRKVVFLGDYIDRGPDSSKIIQMLMDGPDSVGMTGWTWVALRGNHEQMMLDTMTRVISSPDWWLSNGGWATLKSYHPISDELDLRLSDVPPTHVQWLSTLPYHHMTKNQLFVHAGVYPDVPLEAHDTEDFIWMRKGFESGWGHRFVAHGDTPYMDGPIVTKGRINLDTLAWKTGRLVVAVFDEDEVEPIDTLTVTVKDLVEPA